MLLHEISLNPSSVNTRRSVYDMKPCCLFQPIKTVQRVVVTNTRFIESCMSNLSLIALIRNGFYFEHTGKLTHGRSDVVSTVLQKRQYNPTGHVGFKSRSPGDGTCRAGTDDAPRDRQSLFILVQWSITSAISFI